MEHNQQELSSEKNTVRLVFCLSIDLIGSTKAGLKLPTQKLDKFNTALVNQIKPHLEKIELTDALIKFTGDGWLIMTEKLEKVPALCCLATIMANRFQEEMSQETGFAINNIPSIRLAMCFGRDIHVELPDGRKDWVGDSARRATRVSGYCYPNEIIIDETVRGIVFRDFDIKFIDVKQRPLEFQPKKIEEELTLYGLGELKIDAAADSEAPDCFVYTLSVIGKSKDAQKVASQVSERLEDEARKEDIAKGDLTTRTILLNKVIANLPDYSGTLKILKGMRAVNFNVVTYNTLLNKAPDFETAKEWLDKMQAKGILPDIITYNKLISKAPDFETAKEWLDKMQEEGIPPGPSTYSILINKAPDFNTAKVLIEEMRKNRVLPDIGTYKTLHMLVKKLPIPDYKTAKAWIDTMQMEDNYNLLMNDTSDYNTAKALMEEMRKEGIFPNNITYKILSKFTNNAEKI